MIIDHVKVFTEDKKFTDGGIVIKNGTIEQVYTEGKRPQTEDEVLDGKGMYAIPGLIDLHFHGCKGDDFCDGSRDAIARIAEYEASVGVTAIAPGDDDASGRGTGADPPCGSRIQKRSAQ